MTTRSINDQVRIIKDATVKASESKATAIDFLRQAGIIDKKVSGTQKGSSKK